MTRRSLFATIAALFVAPKIAVEAPFTKVPAELLLDDPSVWHHYPLVSYTPVKYEMGISISKRLLDDDFEHLTVHREMAAALKRREEALIAKMFTAPARTDAESLFHTS